MDGSRFDDYAGFAREFTQFLDNYAWHGDLNALNDIMWGGFGTPQGSWTLRWTHSERSRAALGYEETARRLHELLPRVHSTGRAHWQERLDQARRHEVRRFSTKSLRSFETMTSMAESPATESRSTWRSERSMPGRSGSKGCSSRIRTAS